MNLALRNQLQRLTELSFYKGKDSKGPSMKAATAAVLATLLTGSNYYFQNIIADKEN